MSNWRLFLAIPLPQDSKEHLISNTNHLKNNLKGKWVQSNNLHITLAFFGDVPVNRIDDLIKEISLVTEANMAFEISLGGLGAFPSLDRARVLWVGLDKGHKEVANLAKQLRKPLEEKGFLEREDRFNSHITLARFKEPLSVSHDLRSTTFDANTISVPEVVLYKSELRPTGPIYAGIQKFAFSREYLVK